MVPYFNYVYISQNLQIAQNHLCSFSDVGSQDRGIFARVSYNNYLLNPAADQEMISRANIEKA